MTIYKVLDDKNNCEQCKAIIINKYGNCIHNVDALVYYLNKMVDTPNDYSMFVKYAISRIDPLEAFYYKIVDVYGENDFIKELKLKYTIVKPELALLEYLKEMKSSLLPINKCLLDIDEDVKIKLDLPYDIDTIYPNLDKNIEVLKLYNTVRREVDLEQLTFSIVNRRFDNKHELEALIDIRFDWRWIDVDSEGFSHVKSIENVKYSDCDIFNYKRIELKYILMHASRSTDDSFYIVGFDMV